MRGIAYPEGSWQAVAKAGHIENSIQFRLPTIQTRCPHCKGRWPFNPMEADRNWEKSRQSSAVQWFFLSYECQNCKGEPVRFLIRRTREKLTLCGRDPIEAVEVPTVIPKDHAPRFSGSIVAYQSGQTLAAIFLLRVFVEQFWRSIPEVIDAVKPARCAGTPGTQERGNNGALYSLDSERLRTLVGNLRLHS